MQKTHPQKGPILQGTRPRGPKPSCNTANGKHNDEKIYGIWQSEFWRLCASERCGGKTNLKGMNCVNRQGSSSDKIIASICSILPHWVLVERGYFLSGLGATGKSTRARQTLAIQVSQTTAPLG